MYSYSEENILSDKNDGTGIFFILSHLKKVIRQPVL